MWYVRDYPGVFCMYDLILYCKYCSCSLSAYWQSNTLKQTLIRNWNCIFLFICWPNLWFQFLFFTVYLMCFSVATVFPLLYFQLFFLSFVEIRIKLSVARVLRVLFYFAIICKMIEPGLFSSWIESCACPSLLFLPFNTYQIIL